MMVLWTVLLMLRLIGFRIRRGLILEALILRSWIGWGLGVGGNAPVYTVNPTFNLNLEASVPFTIASDSSRLADYVDFMAKASQASFMQSSRYQR